MNHPWHPRTRREGTRRRVLAVVGVLCLATAAATASVATASSHLTSSQARIQAADDSAPVKTSKRLIDEGRQTFRFDTFGDEDFWGGTLQLDRAIAGAANGGVGG